MRVPLEQPLLVRDAADEGPTTTPKCRQGLSRNLALLLVTVLGVVFDLTELGNDRLLLEPLDIFLPRACRERSLNRSEDLDPDHYYDDWLVSVPIPRRRASAGPV